MAMALRATVRSRAPLPSRSFRVQALDVEALMSRTGFSLARRHARTGWRRSRPAAAAGSRAHRFHTPTVASRGLLRVPHRTGYGLPRAGKCQRFRRGPIDPPGTLAARRSSRSLTRIRIPRMQGRPPHWLGLTLMRSAKLICPFLYSCRASHASLHPGPCGHLGGGEFLASLRTWNGGDEQEQRGARRLLAVGPAFEV